jgi:ABC-type oligopeptide transport system ATPase subunit
MSLRVGGAIVVNADDRSRPVGGPLLDVSDLSKRYVMRTGFLGRVRGEVRAVERVSFRIAAGETLGLVGESGSGKTTTGRALLRLIEPDGGRALYSRADGREPVDLFALAERDLRPLRRELQMVFQDPTNSLNPRRRASDTLSEVLAVHGIARGSELEDRVRALFRQVGLGTELYHRYPHELSGGERQRLGIARALALSPRLIVCDEAVSSLDVSIQAQILNLLKDLQAELGIAYLFIAHDLSVVRYLAHRIAVMHHGAIVETGVTEQVFAEPAHPYTRALLAAAT